MARWRNAGQAGAWLGQARPWLAQRATGAAGQPAAATSRASPSPPHHKVVAASKEPVSMLQHLAGAVRALHGVSYDEESESAPSKYSIQSAHCSSHPQAARLPDNDQRLCGVLQALLQHTACDGQSPGQVVSAALSGSRAPNQQTFTYPHENVRQLLEHMGRQAIGVTSGRTPADGAARQPYKRYTAGLVLGHPLPTMKFEYQTPPLNTHANPVPLEMMTKWPDVCADVLARDEPEVEIDLLNRARLPCSMSMQPGVVRAAGTVIIETLNCILDEAGFTAQWFLTAGSLPVVCNSDSHQGKVPQFLLIKDDKVLAYLQCRYARNGFLHMFGGQKGWHFAMTSDVQSEVYHDEQQASGMVGEGSSKTTCPIEDVALCIAYAATNGVKYGGLTTYYNTWLLSHTQPGHVKLSSPFNWEAQIPCTTLYAMWHLSMLALEDENAVCDDAAASDYHACFAARAHERLACEPEANKHEHTASAARGSATNAETWLLRGGIEEDDVHYGYSFAVLARLKDGLRVVVKNSQGDRKDEEPLQHEAHVLTQLKHLPCVEQLVGHGWTPSGYSYWLATEWLDGRTLDLNKHPEDAALLTAAVTGLQQIHKAGYVHGNLGRRNILVLPGADPPIRFVDFREAQACTEPKEQVKEYLALAEIFYGVAPPDDDRIVPCFVFH